MTGTGSGAPFVVRPDRQTARLMQWVFCGAFAVIVVANGLTVIGDEGWALAWRLSGIAAWTAMVVTQFVTWQRMATAGALAEIGPSGLRVHVLGVGWVTLPWTAVASVRDDWAGRVIVRLAEGTGPGTPGTDWPAGRASARRARRGKLYIPTRVTDASPDQVLAAVTYFTGGRL